MSSIPLPFYFLVLMSFLLGALVAFLALVWDKMHLSARHMKATWRVRALEKEVNDIKAAQTTDTPAPKPSLFARRSAPKPEAPAKATLAPALAPLASPAEDIKAPDPDKNA